MMPLVAVVMEKQMNLAMFFGELSSKSFEKAGDLPPAFSTQDK
jgi:hypothetical protein